MALNCSHRPMYSGCVLEDNVMSPIFSGIQERNIDGYDGQWQLPSCREVQDPFGYERDDMDWESVLPADPFGMDMSSTVSAITGFLEFLEADYGGFRRAEAGVSKGDYSLFAGLNFFVSKAVDFHSAPKVDDKMLMSDSVTWRSAEELDHLFFSGDSGVASAVGVMGSVDASCCIDVKRNHQVDTELSVDPDDGAPHPAFMFALAYLGVRDLLNVERVCKSLHYVVKNDPLLWKSIHIVPPLNDCITDDVLLELTSRAQGNLHSLSLVRCHRVTDGALRRVVESNLRLTKLGVAGCTKLSIDGIVNILRDFNMVAVTGIKTIRVGGFYDVTREQFEKLMTLLPVVHHVQANHRKPQYYCRNFYLSCEDDRPIDVEICPLCQAVRLVYDCPAESCLGKDRSNQLCRACILCIPRCPECGKCLVEGHYEETFCLELICLGCCKQSADSENYQIRLSPSNEAASQEPDCSFHG